MTPGRLPFLKSYEVKMPTTLFSLPTELRLKVYILALTGTVLTLKVDIVQKYHYEYPKKPENGQIEPYPALALADDTKLKKRIRKQANTFGLLFVCRRVYHDLRPTIYCFTRLDIIPNAILPPDWHRPEDAIASPYDIMRLLRRISSNRILKPFTYHAHTISMPCYFLEGWRLSLQHPREADFTKMKTLILYEDAFSYREELQWYSPSPQQFCRIRGRRHASSLMDAHDGWLGKVPEVYGFEVMLSVPCS